MKDTNLRTFMYNCKCGNTSKVFIDSGTPQEQYKCRNCNKIMKREEII